MTATTQFIGYALCRIPCNKVRSLNFLCWLLLITIIAEFLSLFNPAISIIAKLDRGRGPCVASLNVLSIFSAQGKDSQFIRSTLLIIIIAEFRHLIVPAIPKIVNLLKDPDETIRMAAVNALSTFSAHGKTVQFIGSPLLMIIIAEFRDLIHPAIHAIVHLLKDNEVDVCLAGADALDQLLKQGMSVNRFS